MKKRSLTSTLAATGDGTMDPADIMNAIRHTKDSGKEFGFI